MNKTLLKDIVAFIILCFLTSIGIIGGMLISKHENYAKGYTQCVKDIMTKPYQPNGGK